MERVKVINLITIVGVAFLALVPKMESMPVRVPTEPRPLCASQFALANYACARLPFTRGLPPSRPSPPDDGDDDDDDDGDDHDVLSQRQGHRHGLGHEYEYEHEHEHGHRHHRHHHTDQEEDCCRWVKQVDSQCVCEFLLRLPPFLVRPVHEYKVTLGDFCNATYYCGGPI
ncbi:hypothetical protein QN277_021594 [Acacia crassicarpa]|uniref:Bifunctional inhibitor/plant lipid transfer protein/seed storage helical domain-containing protein n=1 Tax=Acacia crassicarpa TaxID=499986 RepID=A0AAE1JP60_9FABA|nr:hypothetical protein QN277_021594 [Acacia crassicarpa]